MNYYIVIPSGNKAKNDVDVIVAGLGYKNLVGEQTSRSALARFMTKVKGVCKILTTMGKGDVLFLQYPMKKFFGIACKFAHVKGAKVVTLIHDLGAFRRKKLTVEEENDLLSNSDVIIVHNEEMKRWLLEHGYKNGIVVLGIFDYLSSAEVKDVDTHSEPWKVIFASSLGQRRSKFLYGLDEVMNGWHLELYGNGLAKEETESWKHITYRGFCKSDDLIAENNADFGLVWDGDSIEECCGAWGSYLAINNPHKTSFAYRCHLPVVIWSKAALAPFVVENKAGVVVDSLRDVDGVLSAVTEEQYREMRKNAAVIGERLAEGYYTKKALDEAFALLK